MRLTIEKRKSILKKESVNKFYDKENAIKDSFIKKIESIIKKKAPIVTDKLKPYISTSSSFTLSGYEPSEIPASSVYNYYPRLKNRYEHKVEINDKVISIIKEYKELKKNKSKFESDLKLVLNSFTTSNNLIKAIPEFKKYFKDDVTSVALVPVEKINLIRKSLHKEKKKG